MTTTTAERQRFQTSLGEHVNPYDDLCAECAAGVAQTTAYWATGDGSKDKMSVRLKFIADEVKRSQEQCRELCGRKAI